MSNFLCNIVHTTLSLLLPNVGKSLVEGQTPKEAKDYCHQLATSLDECKLDYVDNLRNGLAFLRTAVSDLAVCYENLEGNDDLGTNLVDNASGDQHLISYARDGLKLERELREIKSDEKAKERFEMATKNFRKSAAECKTICENETLTLQEKVTATKVLVITNILGNLHDLNVAYENCKDTILELHKLQEIRSLFSAVQQTKSKLSISKLFRSEETKLQISSIININKAVLDFGNKFLRKPVAIFDWPAFKEEENPQTFHPIIGQPPQKIDRTMLDMPDPSISIETNGAEINAHISAVNCKGEVFVVAKHKTESSRESSAVVRITSDMVFPFWNLTSEKANELKMEENIQITSISTDCNECSTDFISHNDCKNKVYVLAFYESEGQNQSVRVFVLFVIDIRGKLLHKTELTCLPRRNTREKLLCKIICIKEKILIFDALRREVYLCTKEGDLETRLDVTKQNIKVTFSTATVTDRNEIILLEQPNKIHFYSIDEDRFLDDLGFEASNKVYSIIFNYVAKEVILLCKAVPSLIRMFTQRPQEHYLTCYAKTGELHQDMKLQDNRCDFWENARLISHPSGPVVLLDKNRLLNLQ